MKMLTEDDFLTPVDFGANVLICRPQVSAAAESPGVTVVQLSDGQTVQVHGVIQAPQTSVIQSPQVQTVQVRARDGLCRDLYSYYVAGWSVG